MLFHLGALWRLNELGILPKLHRISSVSGGSITAAVLGCAWERLRFTNGVASNFIDQVAEPVLRLANKTIDVWAVLFGWAGFDVRSALRNHLFREMTLQDLPDRPQFVINASNVQSGALCRFRKSFMWDWRVGKIQRPRIPVATAVAASAAFPPVLSPVVLKFRESDFVPGTGEDLQRPPFTTRMVLTDGGVYDNLGLETAWKQFDTVLVSSASRRPAPLGRPAWDWLRHTSRVISLIHNQVSSVRVRQLIASYESTDPVTSRRGTFWGIASDIRRYNVADALPCPLEQTERLADAPTRLCRFEPNLQQRLVNWGYAIADAAMRRHMTIEAPRPSGFPFPRVSVG